MPNATRINKYLALNNICSRREADRLVADGKVKINGRVAKLGDQVLANDKVELAQDQAREKELVYIAFCKPRGAVTHSPQEGEKQISDIFPQAKKLFPLGRLDKDSEGLIILTNDGRITDRLLNPKYRHKKEYKVTLDRALDSEFIRNMQKGVLLGNGYITKPCKLEKKSQTSFWITITEGKKRQIRKMCGVLGRGVIKLERKRIMNINLRNLRPGQFRYIKGKELQEFLTSLGVGK